ncbi:MAG: TadE/TadG family type IV pilus assembly protein [Pseudomonadota bacterium]
MAVQFVFIIPLFVAFLAIVSDIGGAIWNVQAMQSAVGASARYLSRAPLDEDTANFTAAQIAQAQRLAVCGRVTATGGNGACQAQYAWWTDLSSVSVTLSAVDEDIDTVFDEGFRVVTVTANVQAQWRFLSIVGVDLTATTLSAEETTRYIGR